MLSAKTQAQVVSDCTPALNASCGVEPLIAHIGDTITITKVKAGTTAGDCDIAEIIGFIAVPGDPTPDQWISNGFAPGNGNCVGCPTANSPECTGTGTCINFDTTYVVNPADIGKPLSLSFTDPNGGTATFSNPGVPYSVQFLPAAAGVVPDGGNRSDLVGKGSGQCAVLILTPCITITKECVYPQGRTSFPFGAPISFRGTICNTSPVIPGAPGGASDLVNIQVTDVLPAGATGGAITFNATTSLGNTFSGTLNDIANRLRPNECVEYSGTYTPAGAGEALCGPFTNTISVSAIDFTGATIDNLDECWTTTDGINYTSTGPRAPVSATCIVDAAPCLTVTKTCPASVAFGQPVAYQVIVTNCSIDTPLTGVTVVDSISGTIIGPINLAPGASSTFDGTHAANTIPNNGCGPLVDNVSATAANICGEAVPPATATCTTTITVTPSLSLTKTCEPLTVPGGNSSYTETFVVTNTGNVPLSNVVVHDNNSKLGLADLNCSASLAPGASCTVTRTVATTAADCPTITDTATATGINPCNQQTVTSNSANCTVNVPCPPDITVTKDVACAPNGVCDGTLTYGETATGVASGANCPAFCYRIVVTNNGQDVLNNVTISDPDLPALTIPGTLAIGQVVTLYAQKTWCPAQAPAPGGHVNTVTVSGVGALSGTTVTDNDSATVIVLPISLTCVKYVSLDGAARVPAVEIPADAAPHTVAYTVDITNTGAADLVVTVSDSNPACVPPGPVSVGVGETVTVNLCTLTITCPIENGINTVTVTAVVEQPEEGEICDIGPNGQQITATSTCTAEITCRAQAGCTPGFWKNCTVHWQETNYAEGDLVSSVFPEAATCCPELANKTLLQALSFKGGSGACGAAGNLLRAATAALLNASSEEVDYPRSEDDVIADVRAALGSCTRSAMLSLAGDLDSDNNLGCRGADGEGLPCKVIR